MDAYTKVVLTIIAIALSVIAARGAWIADAQAGMFTQGPTVGDFIAVNDIKDPTQQKEARRKLYHSIPLVRVSGGQVGVSGTVDIDR